MTLCGLTSEEAGNRLAKFGTNAMPDTSVHPLRMAFEKFWAPVPRMLEAAIVLQLGLGKYFEAAIIAVLLAFNAGLGLFQESRAQATLAALKSRLAMSASVLVFGIYRTGFDIERLRTLTFVAIVFVKQATTYTNRERRRMWSSRPSAWLALSSVADILIAVTLSVGGIAMMPLPAWLVAATLTAAAAFAFVLDVLKIPVFRRLGII